MRPLVWVTALALLAAVNAAMAQDSDPDRPVSVSDRKASGSEIGKPFTARLSIDAQSPIVYGDDVVVSVLIAPHDGLDVKRIEIRPKGHLEAIYGDPSKRAPGVSCPVGVGARLADRSFVVNCRLSPRPRKQWAILDGNALLEAKQAQIEVEIVLQDREKEASYYEYITAEFISPRSYVIAGGFFGAVLWAIFLSISAQPPPVSYERIAGWGALWARISAELPEQAANLGRTLAGVLKRAFLGGFTALVLIVLAKGTEGFEPPISLRIQDFWGGMMIGILSLPLAKWLRDKLSTIG